VRIARTGSWRLDAERREPEDLEAQIFEILDQLTGDLAVWQSWHASGLTCSAVFSWAAAMMVSLSPARCSPWARH
jgi:hypothetical protein